MQGDSLFKDYGVYCRDLGIAFKVSLPAKTSLLEPLHTFSLSPLADFAHCCHVILHLMTLNACVCPILPMAALSSSSVVRSTIGWSPSPESLHLAAPLIFHSSCAPVPVSLCVRRWKVIFKSLSSPWHMLISLITPNLHFDVEAQLLDSPVLKLTSKMSSRKSFIVVELMFIFTGVVVQPLVDDVCELMLERKVDLLSPQGGSRTLGIPNQ